jgi:transcriptional regulator with XRE-family HTH domain
VVEVALLFCRVRLEGKKPRDKAYPTEIKTIGDAIRKRRLDLGLNQKDVAKIIGCDQMSVLNWEKGYNKPTINKMSAIGRFLGVHFPADDARAAGAPLKVQAQVTRRIRAL